MGMVGKLCGDPVLRGLIGDDGPLLCRMLALQVAADMARVLRLAGELSRMKADFVVRSRHETASGTAEITVRSRSVWIYAALAAIALVLALKIPSRFPN